MGHQYHHKKEKSVSPNSKLLGGIGWLVGEQLAGREGGKKILNREGTGQPVKVNRFLVDFF